jgi:fibronectin type 3 domain-containing protein
VRYFLSIVILFIGLYAFAQQKKPIRKVQPAANASNKKEDFVKRGNIRLLAQPSRDSIKLRWAVSDPSVWGLCNKYGFAIERYTVSRNGHTLAKLERKLLTLKPLKPAVLKEWETIANTSDHAAIMAQALYGESFSMNVKNNDSSGNSIGSIRNRSAEVQQRYGAFYFSADFSLQAACMGACGYIDTDVKNNEKYLYRVFAQVPAKVAIMDTALAMCCTNETVKLPKLTEAMAIFGDRTVTIGWNHNQANGQYSAYYIDRKKEGEDSFSRITPLPISAFGPSKEKSNPSSQMIYHKDSIGQNYVKYSYRIIGINPFAEMGPYSDTLEGKGAEMLSFSPNISAIDFDSSGKTKIDWEFDKEGEALIKGFELKYATHIDSPYKKVLDIDDTKSRQIKYDIKDRAGYYTIEAIALIGEPRKSFPYLIQPEDSIPPAAPKGLTGWVDSSGLVILHWKPNTERDFAGYKLFKKYNSSNEYSIVTDSLIKDTVYFDFTNNKMMNKKVFYELRAYDRHYNPSLPNEKILRKPDIIPPSPPVFSTFSIRQDSVILTWVNSRDEDVSKILLLRKIGFDSSGRWDTIFVAKQDSAIKTGFTDTKITASTNYIYAIISVDEDGNKSVLVNPLAVITLDAKPAMLYKITSIAADRENRKINIKWQPLQSASKVKIQELQLYRGEGSNKIFLYKILNARDISFTDTELSINTKYTYGIRAVIEGAMPSEFTVGEIIY